MKKDLPWFRHDNSTHGEPVMKVLISEYGREGYGNYWILCEKIASSQDALLDISSRVIKLTVAQDLGMDAECFDKFIGFLSAPDINLINVADGIITTSLIQECYGKVYKKRQYDKLRYGSTDPAQTPPMDSGFPPMENQNSSVENIQSRVDKSRSDQSSSTHENYYGGNIPEATTTTFLCICNSLGYSLDAGTAERAAAGMDASWLSGAFTYPEYIAEAVLENYGEKTPEEKRRLFRSILEKEDRKASFPRWRNAREAEAEAEGEVRRKQGERRRAEEARADRPAACDSCGSKLEYHRDYMGSCPACERQCCFYAESGEWKFERLESSGDLLARLNGGAAAAQGEGMEF